MGTFYPSPELVDSSTPRSAPLSRCTLLRHSFFVRAVCVDALVRICAGGDQRWSSLPRQLSFSVWKPWSFSSGSLAEMRGAAACAEIVAVDSPQLSTVLVPVLRRYSKSTHPVLTSTQGGGSEPLRRRCGSRPPVPKHRQRTFRNAKGLTGADPWPNVVSRVEGKSFRY